MKRRGGLQPLAHVADDLRARHEGAARFFGDDQIDVTLAIALFHVGQTMKLVRQRTQALGQQAHAVGTLDRQLAGLGAHQHAFGADDVADVPALERFVGLRPPCPGG
jgi:hypothetical protein